ncbi:hypothetical protein V1291_001514 [Nitrobacteraceae bacterium AZCC 1564]
MSALKEAAAAMRGIVQPLRMPDTPAVARSAAKISDNAPGLAQPRSGTDYDAKAKMLQSKISKGQPLDARDARDGAWCLWITEPALADHPVILRAVLAAIEHSERKRPARALATSYLSSFAPRRAAVPDTSGTLMRIADRLGKPWDTLQSRYALFDHINGHENVARAAVVERTPPSSILQNSGLPAFDARSGFAKACAEAALKLIESGAEKDPEVCLDLVQRVALDEHQKLIFDDHGPLVANALTLHFETPPRKSLQNRTIALLVSLFGDPRLPKSNWTRMPKAEEIVRRWLTELSLRQFLDIVDNLAIERMWKYRRAFWEAVLRSELIADAWVVFDPQGALAARRALGKAASFGTFDGSVQTGQAALILRIGRGVVAEWSHNGKCVIWSDAERRDAPQLYLSRYTPATLRSPTASDDLNRPVFAVSHVSPDTYAWQTKVAAKIHQMTNVRIQQSQYTVRS